MEDFLLELAELLEVERTDLTNDYILEENENWDSLALVSVVVMLDEHFRISISNEALRNCKSIDDLLKIISNKLVISKL